MDKENLITLDFETYYSPTFSVKKLPTILYVRDPKFKVHGCAIKQGSAPARWVTSNDLPAVFNEINWEDTACISHNALFDMLILYEKYGIAPGQLIDTLGLARALLPHDLDFSLESLAPLLGLGKKGKELVRSRGLVDLPPDVEEAIAGYACQDAELAYGIYKLLWPMLPEDERQLLHMTVRMGTQGILRFDDQKGEAALKEAIEGRQAKIEAVGATIGQLRSRDIFAQMLRDRGVEPPLKLNDKGDETYAFSKQDPEFVRLQANPKVADLVAARMAATSNNAIRRIEHMIQIARSEPYTLPMPLNYSGAHTHRWSGAGKMNVQNLNRGSVLRTAIYAPDDLVIVVVDSAQIELRVNMWLSGQQNILDILAPGEYIDKGNELLWKGHGDVYRMEAAAQFGITPEEVTKAQRSFGKVVQLACGYGMGPDKFRTTCAIGPMGNDPIYITEEEAYRTVHTYRAHHPFVKASWDFMQFGIIPMLLNPGANYEHKCLVVEHEAIRLPNGLQLQYPNLQATENGFQYGLNNKVKYLYGGRLQENCLSADTEVLTPDGWIPIQEIKSHHKVWDGLEWVEHGGLLCKGTQDVLKLWGVWMTPDHQVLTTEGWRDAATAQNRGLNWAIVRIPHHHQNQVPCNKPESDTVSPGATRTAPVFDIADVGPRSRFTVRGRNGEVFLAHNCSQAIARCIIAEQMLAAEREIEQLVIVSQTHDEIIAVHPRNGAEDALRELVRIMATAPSWAEGLPMAAEGGFDKTYSK